MSPGETPDCGRAAGAQPPETASTTKTPAKLLLVPMRASWSVAWLGLRLLQNPHKTRAGEGAVVVARKVDRIPFAGDGDLAAVGLPGAVLHFAADGQVGFAAGAQFEHHVATQVAVGAFESSAGGVDQARQDKPCRENRTEKRLSLRHVRSPHSNVSFTVYTAASSRS